MNGCGIICLDEESLAYARHPLSYMMEAADDICYEIMDIEELKKEKLMKTLTGLSEKKRGPSLVR